MPDIRKVRYAGRDLGEIKVLGRDDWRVEGREPTEHDFRMINGAMVADFVHEAMGREPKRCDESEPDKPWPLVLIREGCRREDGSTDPDMEEYVLGAYVFRHGMNRILEIWGADVGELLGQMEGLIEEDVKSP